MSAFCIGANAANSLTQFVAGDASANTESAYAQVTASLPGTVDALELAIRSSGADNSMLLDLATGAAASETNVIADILCGAPITGIGNFYTFHFPLAIASGTRVAARQQVTTGGDDCRVNIACYTYAGYVQHRSASIVTYGAVAADSGGDGTDPGATINTKGAYNQITGSTSAALQGLTVCSGNQANGARTGAIGWLVDVATGAGGAEAIVWDDLAFGAQSGTHSYLLPNAYGPAPINIAASTRIAVRAQCSINDATDRLIDITLHASVLSQFVGVPMSRVFTGM